MRVTPDEFLGHGTEHIVDIESAGFPGDFRVHNNEQKKIAQFFAKICIVFGTYPTRHFVSLLNQSRQQRFVGLLPIPWPTARAAHLCDDLAESLTGIREF